MHECRLSRIFLCLLFATIVANARAEGTARIKTGYIIADEVGNYSADLTTYNIYDGLALSLNDFKYLFHNGFLLRLDMSRITLNNRDLSINLEKPGRCGIRLKNNQYRRFYDFRGNDFTRRHQTAASFWLSPQKYVKFYGGVDYSGKSGTTISQVNPGSFPLRVPIDYNQSVAKLGLNLNYKGHLIQGDCNLTDFDDRKNPRHDRSHSRIRLMALSPVPRHRWLTLSGGYWHFKTGYEAERHEISSVCAWGRTVAKLPGDYELAYSFSLNRTDSDNDLEATENLAHSFYVSRRWHNLATLTLGYQHGVNDDSGRVIKADAVILSAWIKPVRQFEFRAEHGIRAEHVDEGERLTGDEDHRRFKCSAEYKYRHRGSITAGYEDKTRKNDRPGCTIDFSRFFVDAALSLDKYGYLSAGYVHLTGEYNSGESRFAFADHLFYGDLSSVERHGVSARLGLSYYRCRRDHDIEELSMRFSADYHFAGNYNLDIGYNLHNFDDFLIIDQYFTANIVELSLSRAVSF
jgi:hypothetical protein